MGFRCVFGCLVALAWLVGLYACRVKRLRTGKRNAAHFIGFLGLLRSCSCLLCFVLLLLCSCSLLVVLLVAFFPFGRYDKKKGQAAGACPLFVGCGLVIRLLYV